MERERGLRTKKFWEGFGVGGGFVWLGHMGHMGASILERSQNFNPMMDVDVYDDYLLCVLWDGGLIRRF